MLERIVQTFLKRIRKVKLMPQPSPAMYLAKAQTAAMRMILPVKMALLLTLPLYLPRRLIPTLPPSLK